MSDVDQGMSDEASSRNSSGEETERDRASEDETKRKAKDKAKDRAIKRKDKERSKFVRHMQEAFLRSQMANGNIKEKERDKFVKQMQQAFDRSKMAAAQGITKGKGETRKGVQRDPNHVGPLRSIDQEDWAQSKPHQSPMPLPNFDHFDQEANRAAKRGGDKASLNHKKGEVKQAAIRADEAAITNHGVTAAFTGKGMKEIRERLSLSHAQSLSDLELINLRRGLEETKPPTNISDQHQRLIAKRLKGLSKKITEQIAWRTGLRP